MKTKKYNNPYKKHIAVEETLWAEIRKIKRLYKFHSINETVAHLLQVATTNIKLGAK